MKSSPGARVRKIVGNAGVGAVSALLDPGDEIIITDPHYACYPQLIKIAGGVPRTVRVYEEEGYQIDAGRLRKAITKRTKAVLINSPGNPTGTRISEPFFQAI